MPLTAQFIADFSSFVNAAKDATTSTDELVAAAGKVGSTMDQAVGQAADSLKSVGASVAEFGKSAWSVLNSSELKQFAGDVTEFVTGFVNEFAEAEAASGRLATAVRNMGLPPEVATSYGALATELQKVSTFSDEALTDAITLFTTVGKVAPENMRAVVTAAMDLATVMQVDLATAATMLAKAASSDGDALGKLKTILGDSIPKGADFARVMQAINEKFGGASLDALQTTAGQMENLKNQMSDVNELIGEALADNLQILFDLFKSLPEGIQTFIIAAVAIGTAIAPLLVSFSSLINILGAAGLGGAIATAGEAIATFVGAVVGWPAVIIAAIVALAAAIYFYWDEIVAFLGKAVDKIKYFLTEMLPAAFNAVVDTVAKWYNAVKYWLIDQFGKLVDFVVQAPGRIVDAFKWMFSYVPDMVAGIASEFGKLDRIMVNPALGAVDDVNAGFAGLDSPTLTAGASSGAFGRGAGGGVTVNVNMTGMLGTDDPQTRAIVSDLVSNAVMQGMRGGRLLGTA